MYKYITDLLILCNNFCNPDKNYILLHYNIELVIFEIYFKKYYTNRLVFNSINSEILFIYIFNTDEQYILKKYNKNIHSVLKNFFIKNKIYYFNKCHKNFNISDYKKMHLKNCNCPIKVKSIVNLKILLFLNIIKKCKIINENYNNNNLILIKNNENSITENNIIYSNENNTARINENAIIANNITNINENINKNVELLNVLNKLNILKSQLDTEKIYFNKSIKTPKIEIINNDYQLNSEIDIECFINTQKKSSIKKSNIKKSNIIESNIIESNIIEPNIKELNIKKLNIDDKNTSIQNSNKSNILNIDKKDKVKLDTIYMKYSDVAKITVETPDIEYSDVDNSDIIYSDMAKITVETQDIEYSDVKTQDIEYSDVENSDIIYSDVEKNNSDRSIDDIVSIMENNNSDSSIDNTVSKSLKNENFIKKKEEDINKKKKILLLLKSKNNLL